MPADLYLILGVTPDANEAEIRAAWRRQVRYWHPDRNPDPRAARRIQLLNHAYDVLSDPAQRSTYDGGRAFGDSDDDDDDITSEEFERATAPPPPPDPTMDPASRGAVPALLDLLDPLLEQANLLHAHPPEPPADSVERWAGAATALIEQRLGWWHTYAQHLRLALTPRDPRLRLVKAQTVLSAVRADGLAGNIRPDVPRG